MKLKSLTVACLALIISACSTDDSSDSPTTSGNGGGTQQTTTTGDYFPLASNNEWNYNVVNKDNATGNETDSTDNLKVESQSGENYTLSVNNGAAANGTMSGLLTSGELTTTDTQLTATGEFGSPIDGIPLSIPFVDAKFYDTTANLNATLYTNSDVITQTIQNIPFTINYSLKSTQLDNLDSYTHNGVTYTNVTSAKLTLNLKVQATVTVLGFDQTVDILSPQDVVVVTSYYTDGVGLVNAESETGYTLTGTATALLVQAGIDIPTSIDTYTVN